MKRIFKRMLEKDFKGIEGSYAVYVGDDCKMVVMKPVSKPPYYAAPTDSNTKVLYKGEPIEKEISMQEYVNLLSAHEKAKATARAR